MYIKFFLVLLFAVQSAFAQQQCIAEVTGSPFAIAGGAGPFAIAFSPFVNNNLFLGLPSTVSTDVTVFSVNTLTGVASAVAGSPFASGTTSFGISYSPVVAGNLFAAVPNRTGGNITVYSANTTTGALTPIVGSPFAEGVEPFAISYSPLVGANLFAAVTDITSDQVTSYVVNTATGAFTAASTVATGSFPFSVAFSPNLSGTLFAAVANTLTSNISVYSVNTVTGVLTPVVGSPFATSASPSSIAFSPLVGGLLFASTVSTSVLNTFSVNTTTGAFSLINTMGVTGALSVSYSDVINGKLYAAIASAPGSLHVYSVNTSTGVFTEITGSPISISSQPNSVDFSPLINYQIFIATANSGGNTTIARMTFPPTLLTATQQNPCVNSLITVTGMAEPGVTLDILADGQPIGSGVSDTTGNFSFASTSEITQGTHAITISQTSGLCNGSSSNSINIDINLAPVLLTAFQENSCVSSLITVTGTAESLVSLNIFADAQLIGSGSSDNAGNFSFSSNIEIAQGTHAITVVQTSGVCNGSSSNSINVDINLGPVLTSAVQQNSCINSLITVTGTAEPNVALDILADGQPIGSGSSDNAGNFNFSSSVEISRGTHAITILQTSGICTGSSSNSISVIINLGPVLSSVFQRNCNLQILVTGTAEPGATLEILADGQLIGSVTSDQAGDFSFSPSVPLTEGVHSIMIAQTSGVCAGQNSNSFTVTIKRCQSGSVLVEAIRNKYCPFLV